MRIALAGDVMLGRKVADAIQQHPAEYVWGNVLPSLRAADLRIINLECVIARPDAHQRWMPPKAFYFIAPPDTIRVLQAARIDVVTLSNNHTLDYRETALVEMLELLDEAGIKHAGAGRTAAEAQTPVFVETPELRIAIISFTDNEPAWEATESRPGTFFVPISVADPRFERLKKAVHDAKQRAEIVLVTTHWGPNMLDRPLPQHPPFARALLDAGADCVAGNSAHVFQGIERCQGKPILYDLGDFADDYAVDPYLRNDRSFLWFVDLDRNGVKQLELLPVLIDGWACQVNLATDLDMQETLDKMAALCAEMDTPARIEHGRLIVSVRE